MEEEKELSNISAFLLFILLIGVVFEVAILGIAFFGADKVECNLLWCTFTTERTNINDRVIIETHKTCFYNGYEIDCNNSLPIETIHTDGNFDSKPIFKHDKEWKDVLEYIGDCFDTELNKSIDCNIKVQTIGE